MKKTRLRRKKELDTAEEEDYDFDMSIYEDSIDNFEEADFLDDNKVDKNINPFRAKWTPHDLELDGIEQIKTNASKYGIAVESMTDNINELFRHLGCLGEYWARIKYVCNKLDRTKVQNKINNCREILLKNRNKNPIPPETHFMLLELRDHIYKAAQMKGFGFSIDVKSNPHVVRAEKLIIQ